MFIFLFTSFFYYLSLAMSRIKRLEIDELTYLRTKLRAVYSNHHPREILPPQNAYLPNYQDIKNDMHHHLPEAKSSISENRLRKLFYYTDPEMVPEGALQAPNFGIDFLDACYLYVTNGQFVRNEFRRQSPTNLNTAKKRHWPWWQVTLFFVFVSGGIWLLTSKAWLATNQDGLPVRESFNEVTPEMLMHRGWTIQDPDTTWLNMQFRTECFTLYTLPGSFWVKPQEPISVPNTLLYKLPSGAAGVRACFDAFVPDQNWQSTGMVLFNAELDREDLVYMSFGYAGSLKEAGQSPWVISATRLRRGVPDMPFFTKLVQIEQNSGDKIRLDLSWTHDEIRFYSGVNESAGFSQEWDPFMKIGAMGKPFEPAYVGLFACQGWTNDDLRPLQADTIPVYLNWVEIY